MFDYSGAYASPMRKRPMVNDAQMPDISMGEQQAPSFLDGISGPQPPSYGDSFLAGMQQNPKGNRLAAGLSGWAGAGGIRGGIGSIAKFLI